MQPGDPGRVRLLLFAAIHGIASLVTSGSVDAKQTSETDRGRVALFAHGPR